MISSHKQHTLESAWPCQGRWPIFGPSSAAKAHGELIKKHLTLVDETPHMGMLYGLHLSDMLQDQGW